MISKIVKLRRRSHVARRMAENATLAAKAGNNMMQVFTPIAVNPPCWSKTACKVRPMGMASAARRPRMTPTKPLKSKCQLDGPILM